MSVDLKDPNKEGISPKPKRRSKLVQERFDLLRLEIASTPLSTSGLVKRFSKEWRVGERQIRIYLAELRDEMRTDLADQAPALREECIMQVKAFYAACMAKRSYAAAGRAQDRLISLYGLNAPQRVELTGRDGAPIPIARPIDLSDKTDAEIAALASLLGIEHEEPPTH